MTVLRGLNDLLWGPTWTEHFALQRHQAMVVITRKREQIQQVTLITSPNAHVKSTARTIKEGR